MDYPSILSTSIVANLVANQWSRNEVGAVICEQLVTLLIGVTKVEGGGGWRVGQSWVVRALMLYPTVSSEIILLIMHLACMSPTVAVIISVSFQLI